MAGEHQGSTRELGLFRSRSASGGFFRLQQYRDTPQYQGVDSAIAAAVRASRLAQGLPERVSDPAALERIARLIGQDTRRPAASPSREGSQRAS